MVSDCQFTPVSWNDARLSINPEFIPYLGETQLLVETYRLVVVGANELGAVAQRDSRVEVGSSKMRLRSGRVDCSTRSVFMNSRP
jgi:hypothetical protein